MNEAILTTSLDDGHPLDLKLADLLAKYCVPGTFYIPLGNGERPAMDASRMDKAELLRTGAKGPGQRKQS